MREIESAQNSLIQKYAKLCDKKYRREFSLYLAEGEKLVFESIEKGVETECVLVSISKMQDYEEKLQKVFEKVIVVSEAAFKKVSTDAAPQGILAVLKQPQIPLQKPKGKGLILDRISDPGNLGTIIRSANAFGYNDIYLINCTDAYAPRAVRGAMSGLFSVNLTECTEEQVLQLCSDRLKICADMGGKSLFSQNVPQNHMILIGSESFGVSETLKQGSDITLSIPMREGAESLNAGVAASIFMAELSLGKSSN